MDFSPLFDPQNLPGLLTLTVLEVILGIDNVIFITILAGKLPASSQGLARQIGLAVALISRILLLMCITWVMKLDQELFTFLGHGISWKDLILIGGGLFLLGKATHEIYENVEKPEDHASGESEGQGEPVRSMASFMTSFLIQVVTLDVIFSLDSVITAVGLINDPAKISIMVAAVVLAVIVMIIFAKPVGDFVQRHASIRVLALSFLVLIGTLLVAEGFGQHIEKGYVYFAMAFAFSMELLNMRMRSKVDSVASEV